MSSTTIEHHRERISLRWVLAIWQFAAAASSLSALLDQTTPQILLPVISNRTLPWDGSISHHDHHSNHDNPNQIETLASWNNQRQHRSLQTSCVRNQRQLISVIRKAPNFTYTNIDICSKYIAIDARQTNMGTDYQGIFLNQKIIDFRCRFSNKCIWDAQGLSRHFYSFNSTITFRGVQFINGNANNDIVGGGSLCFEISTLILIRCDMSNNIANWGGGIALFHSNLLLYGDTNASSPSLFENNIAKGAIYDECGGNAGGCARTSNGNGGAINIYGNSKVTTMNGYFLFSNHYACYDGGAIYAAYGGDVNVTNIVFRNNSAGRGGAFAGHDAQSGFKHVVFQRNYAEYGASIYQDTSQSLLRLENVTILNNTELTNAMVYLVDSRADVRMLSVMKSFQQDAGPHDFVFGSTIFVESETGAYLDGEKSSGLNVALSPPNRNQAQRDRELTYESERSWQRRRSLQPCVFTAASLHYQVNACDSSATGRLCIISICSKLIRIPYVSPTNSSIISGIDLSHMKIKIVCRRTKWRCRFDGQGRSRIFHGSNASITFRGIVFINGYHSNAGGAIMMKDGSDVSACDCSFENNTASFGSAIALYNSSLHVAGNRTTFINNQGDTPPIFSNQSALDLSDAIFVQNVAAKYGGGGVLLFNSTFDLFNVTFSNRSINPSENCDVFTVFDSNNLLNGGYCFNYVQ